MVTRCLRSLLLLAATFALTTASPSSPKNARNHTNLRVLQPDVGDGKEATPECQCQAGDTSAGPSVEPITVYILVFDSQGIIDMVAWNARDYEIFTGGRVKIEIRTTPTMAALFEEIENDARAGGGLYDAYYTNPVILGTAATLNGFLDLTPFVKESPYSDWADVLLALRTYVTSFEEKILMILLDGDTHTLFYRKDVLEAFNLKPPRSWNEYNEVAQAVHGKTFNGVKLSGSCVSRRKGDHAQYWSHLVLSTITQTKGTSQGSLFDTEDMTPLTGEAVAEMIRLLEEQAKYGVPNEFEGQINAVTNAYMNNGQCVLTFMWGDLFRRSKAEGSVLHNKLGIAPTPGSEFVLNRETGKLERCTREICPYATYYDDLGFVNYAPYAANGGWGGAISANASPEKQKATVDFLLWASSKEQSQQYVIPNATLPVLMINGQDPWRKSHLDVDKWVAQGFDRELSRQYVESIVTNLVSKNVVVEMRFPKAGEIMAVLDVEVNEHLVRVKNGLISETEKERERLKVAQRLTDAWNQIIRAYDARGDTVAPILEVYQRLRGVYIPDEQKNLLKTISPFGLVLMAVIVVSSLGAAAWVAMKRDVGVVKASQPVFLGLICLGTVIMGVSIVPMGIDDGVAAQRGCDIACMATPWLIAIGFSVSFAALFSKIWRLNRLMKSAVRCRRVQVTTKDVLLPFAILLVLNCVFLLVWTVVDPLYWERVNVGRNEGGELVSYGHCTSSGTTSLVMIGLITAINAVAVILANIQAYQTRKLTVAYNESKFVALSMASILQAFLIGLPLLFLSNTTPTSRYVVRSLLIFVICMSMLGFIFVPKILSQRKNNPEESMLSSALFATQQSIQAAVSQRGAENIVCSVCKRRAEISATDGSYPRVKQKLPLGGHTVESQSHIIEESSVKGTIHEEPPLKQTIDSQNHIVKELSDDGMDLKMNEAISKESSQEKGVDSQSHMVKESSDDGMDLKTSVTIPEEPPQKKMVDSQNHIAKKSSDDGAGVKTNGAISEEQVQKQTVDSQSNAVKESYDSTDLNMNETISEEPPQGQTKEGNNDN